MHYNKEKRKRNNQEIINNQRVQIKENQDLNLVFHKNIFKVNHQIIKIYLMKQVQVPKQN